MQSPDQHGGLNLAENEWLVYLTIDTESRVRFTHAREFHTLTVENLAPAQKFGQF